MHRCKVYLCKVFLFLVVVVFSWLPSSSYSAANNVHVSNTTFVNTTRSPLKILGIFGHFGKSHFQVFKPLIEELARRGHHVTVISYFPRSKSAKEKEPLPTYKDISVSDPKRDKYMNMIDLHMIKHDIFRPLSELMMIKFMANTACKTVLNHPAIKEFLLSDEKFDLIITETFNTDCFLGFVHRFKIPYISLLSHQLMPWLNEDIGNVDNPSYIPNIFMGVDKPMDLPSRLMNTLITLFAKIAYEYWFRFQDQLIANEVFGPDLPALKKISKQVQAVLVNIHSSLHGSVPLLPNIVEVGGLHIPPRVNPLPKDIAEFLDNAHEGVLYFNLGSMIKMTTMPQKKLDAILDVFGSIPRKVIWKWESDVLSRKLDNVIAKQWLPQLDVLNHPNVKCYMGHGGLLGLSEGVYMGVPMVLIPMYGDQFHNSAAAKNRGVAEVIAFNDLDEHSLRRALDKVFNDTSYFENAQRLSKAFRDRPATPLETAVWWTEYIARGNGGSYLHSDSADIAWYQYCQIDVAVVLIIVIALFIYIIYRLIKLLPWLVHAVIGTLGSGTKETSKKKD